MQGPCTFLTGDHLPRARVQVSKASRAASESSAALSDKDQVVKALARADSQAERDKRAAEAEVRRRLY